MLRHLIAGFAVSTVVASATLAAQQPARVSQPQAGYPTDKQMADSKEAQRHVAAAMALAKPDLLTEAQSACGTLGPQRPALVRQAQGLPPVPRQLVPPTKIFDNLFYFGFNDIGAWAITTTQGIILIDTLNTPEEAEQILVPEMKKVGLDAADVKYIILGHGHFDHFGGAPYFQTKYKSRVLMAAADWDFIATQRNRVLPTRDMDITDGQRLTLGDTTVTMVLTPGHTPGSIAILMPVRDRGKPYTALMLSGVLQTPDRQSLTLLEHALNDFAKPQKAAIVLNGHPGIFGDPLAWMDELRRNPRGPNPFVYGEARFARYMDIMLECSRARVAAMDYKE